MSERSVTIWNLVVGFSIVSIIAMSFKLFPMNKKFNRLKDRSADLQFGTDKELENIISYLEGRLEDRSNFQFVIENTPMLLTNVLSLADGGGGKAPGIGTACGVGFGTINRIDGTQVLIQTNNGIKSYPAPGFEPSS